MSQQSKNLTLWYANCALYNTAITLISGSILQAILLHLGIPGTQVTTYVSIMLIIQVGTMILFSPLIEKIQKLISVSAFIRFAIFPFYFVLIFLCGHASMSANTIYWIVFAASILLNILQALQSVLTYKLPYHIMNMARFGRYQAISGIVNGLLGFAFSAVFSYVIGISDYLKTIQIFLWIGSFIMILSGVLGLFMKKIHGDEEEKISLDASNEKPKKINLFTYKPFTVLLIPNFFRGIFSGFISVISTIGIEYAIINTTHAPIMTSIVQIATLLSCLFYAKFINVKRTGIFILCGTIIASISYTVSLSFGPIFFLVAYFIGNFFMMFVDFGIPASVVQVVNYEIVGQYSSWRMLTHTLGTSIGAAIILPLMQATSPLLIAIFMGVLYIICGITYYWFLKKCKKLITE